MTDIARNTDPVESHQAAAEITNDGSRRRMMELTLQLLQSTPNLTANELEARHGYSDGQLRKRLNDLRKEGLVEKGPSRKSRITGKTNATWRPV